MALVITLLATAPARAEFEGTPGKVAYVDGTGNLPPLKVWDPARDETTTIEAQTVELPSSNDLSLGVESAPAWSPDGTKLAYVKSIDATGNSPIPVMETAVFVYDLKTGSSTKLTGSTAAAFVDPNPMDTKAEGHSAADLDPAWSPSGLHRGLRPPDRRGQGRQPCSQSAAATSGRSRPPAGSPVQGTHYTATRRRRRWRRGMVWIPGSNDVLVGQVDKSGSKLVRQPVTGGGATTVASTQPIVDFDVSPDGKRFGFTTAGAGGVTGFEGELGTGGAIAQGDMAQRDAALLQHRQRAAAAGLHPARPRVVRARSNACATTPTPDINPDEKDRMTLKWPVLTSVPGGGFGRAGPGCCGTCSPRSCRSSSSPASSARASTAAGRRCGRICRSRTS